MRIDLLRKLIHEATQKGIFVDDRDAGEDLMAKILIALLQQKEKGVNGQPG